METMQALALADDLVGPVRSGIKKNTIRAGRRALVPGPLRFEAASGSGETVTVEVTAVRHALARDLTLPEIEGNGFADMDGMLSGMKVWYPDFGPESEVTVVSWD